MNKSETESDALEEQLSSVDELVSSTSPKYPLYCVRPKTIIQLCHRFIDAFKGTVLYAVKCNADPYVLDSIWKAGVCNFDCASIGEIQLVKKRFPLANTHFLNPIKSKEDIKEAYCDFNVQSFSLDSIEELTNIMDIVNIGNHEKSTNLTLLIRLALPDENREKLCLYPLNGKLGVEGIEASANLLKLARNVADRLGICFHVGSQCTEPTVFTNTLKYVSEVIKKADVSLDIIDVGGGFPATYPHSHPPPLTAYMAAIDEGCSYLPSTLTQNLELWSEPGRALVAEGCSLVVRVLHRRSNRDVLHINDGTYGNLRITGSVTRWQFPVRLLRNTASDLIPFKIFGPTCDTVDSVHCPFLLPADTHPDDYIEIGQFGAYNKETSTGFNGYNRTEVHRVRDLPIPISSSIPLNST